jgi:hemolysin III
VTGGVLYSIGVVFHMWNRLPFQNAIWHGFVLAAAACHYAAIMHEVVPNA